MMQVASVSVFCEVDAAFCCEVNLGYNLAGHRRITRAYCAICMQTHALDFYSAAVFPNQI